MAKIPAPAAKALLEQATARWPARSKASDGIVPSAAHTAANPSSDHEPLAPPLPPYCHAADLTHDPAHGCDCGRIAEALRVSRDRRIKYVIHDSRIFDAKTWTWRAYSGSNPHEKHMHVSILGTLAACEDTRAWPGITSAPKEEPVVVITLITPPVESWHRFWRLRSTQGDYLYTSSPAEVQSAANANYVYEGVGFDIAANDPTNVNSLYRLTRSGWHHYCLAAERDALVDAGWVDEGVVAKVGSHGQQVVRLAYGPSHLFTTSEVESAAAVKAGWTREGIAWGCGVVVPHVCDDKAARQIAAIKAVLG